MAETSRSLNSIGYSHYGHAVSSFLEEGISINKPDINYNLANDIIFETPRENRDFLPLLPKLMNEGKNNYLYLYYFY